MVAARAVLVTKTELSREDRNDIAAEHGIGTDRIHRAKTVLDFAGDLADSVVSGAVSLDQAYATARQRKADADTDEAKRATIGGSANRNAPAIPSSANSGVLGPAWQHPDHSSLSMTSPSICSASARAWSRICSSRCTSMSRAASESTLNCLP